MAALPNGTGFTNLSRLIGANSNNKLGDTVQQGVQKDVQSLNNNVQQSQDQFNQNAQNNSFNNDINQQYVSGTIGGIANAPAIIQQGIAPAEAQKAPLGSLAPPSGAQSIGAQEKATTQSQDAYKAPTSGPSTQASSITPSSFTPTTSTPDPSSAPQPTMSTPAPSVKSVQDLANLPGSFGLSKADSGATATNMQGQGFTAPTQGDISRFGQYLQGGYAGPQQLNNYQSLVGQAQNLQNMGRNASSPGGLQSLLQQYIGGSKSGYNKGEQGLDTLILGQTGKPQLQNITRSTQNLNQIPMSAEAQAEAKASMVANSNNDFKQQILSQLAAGENPILQNVQGNIGALNDQNTAYQDKAKGVYDLLSKNNPANATDLDKLNNSIKALTQASENGMVTNDQLSQITSMLPKIQASGGDLEAALQGMFTYNPQVQLPQYSMQQGANSQQAAQLNALQQLGQDASGQFAKYGGLELPKYGFDLSKAPQFGPDGTAGNPGPPSAPNRGALYDMFNTVYGPAIGATSAYYSGLGTGINDGAQGLNQLAHGDINGADNTVLGAPADIGDSATHSFEGQLDNSETSLDHLIGTGIGSELAKNGVATAKNDVHTPLSMINTGLRGTSDAAQGLASDLTQGHADQAIGNLGKNMDAARIQALNQLATGVGNTWNGITGGVNNVSNGVSDFVNNPMGGKNSAANQAKNYVSNAVGTFFCSELYSRNLASINEAFEMSKFLLTAVLKQTKMVLFYANNGEAIAAAANKHDFNWSSIKHKLIDEVIGLMNSGRTDESHHAYSLMIKEMCLKFPETESLWDESNMKTNLWDTITLLPKVMRTKSFKKACKIYFMSKIDKLVRN